MTADPALRFWLDWAESGGAACERGADAALVLMPSREAVRLGLAEEITVTSEPEVARDDGALLLTAGHPLVHQAADEVLAFGDVGRVELARPGGALLTAADLLARARNAFFVDHGKLDLAGEPMPCVFPMLRVGVLITYHVSQQDSYQERAEQWIDVETGAELPARLAQRLAGTAGSEGGSAVAPLPEGIGRAYALAHAALVQQAERRARDLSVASVRERTVTLTRTGAYYDAVLEGLESRMSKATPERRMAYAARIEATKAERARRLAEVEEGYRPRSEVRPYRLHLIGVPGVTVPVEVQRGPRRYPFPLAWLSPASEFLPRPCPACGSGDVLIATKKALGCRACLAPPPQERAVTAPRVPHRKAPAPTAGSVGPAPITPVAPSAAPAVRVPSPPRASPAADRLTSARAGSAAASIAAADLARMQDRCSKAGIDFWQYVARTDRRVRRVVAPGSPMGALVGLYGQAAPLVAVGLEPGDRVESVELATTVAGDSLYSCGDLTTSSGSLQFALRWSLLKGAPMLHEVLPSRNPWLMWRLTLRQLREHVPVGLFDPGFAPAVDPDPVSLSLLRIVLPLDGLPLVARCLSVRGGVSDPELEREPAVFACALRYEVARLSREQARYADVASACRIDEGALRAAVARLRRQIVADW